MDLLERDEALAVLRSCRDEAVGGQGRLVLVAGEAGIGKTSLTAHFCSQHEQDSHVWWGACDALSTPRPLGPLDDIAAAAGGSLAAMMAGDVSPHERFQGFLAALNSPLRPVIAVVEDAHWADEATRDLLIFIARRVADTHAVVIVTYRDDEIGAEHPMRAVLGRLVTAPAIRRVQLSPLSSAAIATMVPRSVDADRVHRVTGGNPFFVTEMLAAEADTVPRTVGDAVLARTSMLSAPGRAALEAASVVPDQVEMALLRHVAGADLDGVDECIENGLLVGDPRSVRFRHELARLAVEQTIPAIRMAGLHADALSFLRTQPDVAATRLVYHAEHAQDPAAVLEFAPQAAAQARRLGAHREAAQHYRRAIDVGDGLAAHERAELIERYAEECTAIDSELEAIHAAERAVDEWRRLGEVERAAVVLSRLAYVQWGIGRSDEARTSLSTARSLLEGRPASRALATTYTFSAHLHMLAREIPQAIELGEQAVELAESFDDVPMLARALNIVGAALWFQDPDRAEATLGRALDVARRSGDDTIVGIVMRMLGSGAGEVRRYQVADTWLHEGVRWCSDHDLDIHGDYCLAWSARSAFEQGRWSEATTMASDVVARSVEHTPTRIVALTTLGRLRVRRGDPHPEEPLAKAWELARGTGDLQRMWPAAAARAEAAWLADRSELIPDLIGDTYELACRLGHQYSIGELALWLWLAGELTEPPENAYGPYALQITGDWAAAAAEWRAIGCPYEVSCSLAESSAPADLLVAMEGFAQLGARPMADRVATRLRTMGVERLPRQPTRDTLANPAGLTDRELEVLTHVSAGRTNVEIGGLLHISPKTAGHHVSAILAKLGAENRREAARMARDSGIVSAEIGR